MEQTPTNEPSSTSTSKASTDLKARYPNLSDFSLAFGTERQLSAINRNRQFATDPTSPRLYEVGKVYGDDQAYRWMISHLAKVFGVTLSDGIMPVLDELAKVLFEMFFFQRVTAFILFCGKCRAHEYKISYGTVKADAVLEAANEFLRTMKNFRDVEDDDPLQPRKTYTPINSWRDIHWLPLYVAWHDATVRRLRTAGAQGIMKSLMDDDEYHAAIVGMIETGVLCLDMQYRPFINEQRFYENLRNYAKTDY